MIIKIEKTSIITVIMIFSGVFMLGYGISRGEIMIVFVKAVNICLECIGVG